MYVLCVSVEALVGVQDCGVVYAMPSLLPSCLCSSSVQSAAGLLHTGAAHKRVCHRVTARCLCTAVVSHLCGESPLW